MPTPETRKCTTAKQEGERIPVDLAERQTRLQKNPSYSVSRADAGTPIVKVTRLVGRVRDSAQAFMHGHCHCTSSRRVLSVEWLEP